MTFKRDNQIIGVHLQYHHIQTLPRGPRAWSQEIARDACNQARLIVTVVEICQDMKTRLILQELLGASNNNKIKRAKRGQGKQKKR